jgi:cold shock protein
VVPEGLAVWRSLPCVVTERFRALSVAKSLHGQLIFEVKSQYACDIGGDPLIGQVALSVPWAVTPITWRSFEMATGTVKWFNPTKGYGFIQPQGGGGRDVFVHISAVERAGLSTLNEGQQVEYEEVSNRGKTSAENLKVK